MKVETKSGRLIMGMIVGALAGAAAGLLVAPQPGRDTREVIRRKTGGYVGILREKFRRNISVNGAEEPANSHAEVSS